MELGLDGKTHFSLVVSDPERSSAWYRRVFDFREMQDVEASGIAVPGGTPSCAEDLETRILFQLEAQVFLGLARPIGGSPAPFSHGACGLQHFALHVRSRDHLEQWIRRLAELGIDHSGIQVEGPGLLLRFCDPDGIPVEVYWTDPERARALFVKTAREGADASARRRRGARNA
jgi:glyoxylase I family protein